jgi:hypothetical protein
MSVPSGVITLGNKSFLNYPLFLIFFFPSIPRRRLARSLALRQPRMLTSAPESG